MSPEQILDLLALRVPMRTSRALSRTIMEMVSSGHLASELRMPTVRAVAGRLSMSAASVAVAWRELVDWRVLETRRRGGTTILGPPVAPRATRYDTMMKASSGPTLNLGHMTPDPAMIPPIEPALLAAARSAEVQNNVPTPISQALRAAVEPEWPFAASYFLATHGGVDAVDLALRTSVRPGDKVLVQTPTISRVLDILDSIGAAVVPIETGSIGPDLGQIRKAVRTRPAAFIYQPGGTYSSTQPVSFEWLAEAAQLLADIYMPIIEVTQTPFLEQRPWQSLGRYLPQSVVHVHSYNFFFGSDLRVGVAAGSDYYVDRMWQQLTFSSRWVSRILQDALAFQLTDATAQQHLDRYVDICRTRHRTFTKALRRVGFDLPETIGPSIWLPVPDDQLMVTRMSHDGIVVHPGRYFSPAAPLVHHVLINGTVLAQDHDEIALLVARAAGLVPG